MPRAESVRTRRAGQCCSTWGPASATQHSIQLWSRLAQPIQFANIALRNQTVSLLHLLHQALTLRPRLELYDYLKEVFLKQRGSSVLLGPQLGNWKDKGSEAELAVLAICRVQYEVSCRLISHSRALRTHPSSISYLFNVERVLWYYETMCVHNIIVLIRL